MGLGVRHLARMAISLDYRQARNRFIVAPEGLSPGLDLESSSRPAGPTGDPERSACTDPQNEPRESAVGSAPHPRRIAQTGHRYRRDQCRQVHGPNTQTGVANLANLTGESRPDAGLRRLFHGAYDPVSGSVWVPGSTGRGPGWNRWQWLCDFTRREKSISCSSRATVLAETWISSCPTKKTPLWGKGGTIFRFDHGNARARGIGRRLALVGVRNAACCASARWPGERVLFTLASAIDTAGINGGGSRRMRQRDVLRGRAGSAIAGADCGEPAADGIAVMDQIISQPAPDGTDKHRRAPKRLQPVQMPVNRPGSSPVSAKIAAS